MCHGSYSTLCPISKLNDPVADYKLVYKQLECMISQLYQLGWYSVKRFHLRLVGTTITESVDSVCRDGIDMPYVAIQTEAWKTLLKQQL